MSYNLVLNREEFHKLVEWGPLVSIDLIIKNKVGEVLLGKRRNPPAKNYWFVPGGRIRKLETMGECFARVTRCEIGVEISIDKSKLIGAFEHIYEDSIVSGRIPTHYISLGFELLIEEECIVDISDQHSDFIWASEQEILANPEVHENVKLFFQEY